MSYDTHCSSCGMPYSDFAREGAKSCECHKMAAQAVRDFVFDKPALSTSPVADAVATVSYTNWRGETSVRRIIPKSVRYGSTEWHPEPQWLLLAWDNDKKADREFALKDFGACPVAQEPVALRHDGELKPMLCLPWAAHGPEVYAMGREDLIAAGVKTYNEALAHPEIKVQPERICVCDFESPYASDQKQIDAEARAQFIAQLANTRAEEIARVAAIFDGWLERYEHGTPIQFTPAREYAADAVRDCRDAILALLSRRGIRVTPLRRMDRDEREFCN